MSRTVPGRNAAHLEGDFAVFLIGVRLVHWWNPVPWAYIFYRIWSMLRDAQGDGRSGLLHYQAVYIVGVGFSFLQYWRSFDALERYSRDPKRSHLPMWQWYNRDVGNHGPIGIWHESYLVRAGQYECVYGNMPHFGLAKAGSLVPIAAKGQSAARRLGLAADDVPGQPVPD